MSDSGDDQTTGDADWPVDLRGVTESIVTTRGPGDRWNVAALGLHAGDPVTARTWGRTRTWRNFRERGGGYLQFTRDPVDFVDAALAIREQEKPVLASADAWVRVRTARVDAGRESDTRWVEWALHPVEATVERRAVPTTNRGYYAVVEATVAASRLDVDAHDRADLEARLDWLATVVETCGGVREQEAFKRIEEFAEW